jgi:hypothetical protein
VCKVPRRIQKEIKGLVQQVVYASLITASKSWHGVRMTPDICLELGALRRQTFGNQKPEMPKELVAV